MRENETKLGLTKFDKGLIIVIPMFFGGLIGWFIPFIAQWLLKLPIVPLEKLIGFIASLNSPWVSIVATIIGIIVGILLTFIIFDESLEITVSDHQLQFKLGDKLDSIEKKDISAIYMENKEIIVLSQESCELYRGLIDIKKGTVQDTFTVHHYPWHAQDPFQNEYERWVLGHPDFPEKVGALLYAREQALKEDKKKDTQFLREDLAKLGAVIKDERNGQYVRLVRSVQQEKK